MHLTLCLTHDCNLACRYCYAGPKHARSMSWAVADRALELGLAEAGTWLDLSFFGGEPLLEWELLQRCVREARHRSQEREVRVRFQLTTNGILLDTRRARFLREEGVHLGVSIDGCREAHDATRPCRGGRSSFDATLRGLDVALAEMPRVEVIAVVDPASVAYLARSVCFLLERGVRRLALNLNFQGVWDPHARATLEEQYALLADHYVERYRAGEPAWINTIDGKVITHLKQGFSCRDRCSMGCRELSVAASGNLYPCERLVGEDTDTGVRMGSVFTGIDRERQERYRREAGNVDRACGSCELAPRCMHWCGCTNYALTGAINRTGGLVCWHEQVAIREADRAAAVLFREANRYFLREHYGSDVGHPEVALEPSCH